MSRKKNKPKPKQKSSGKPKSAKKQARIPKANKPAKTSTKPRITRTSKNKSPQVEETHDPSSPDPRLRVKAFFANYPGFRYNPSRPVMEEFYRLCDITWPDRGDWERDIAWRGFRDALTQQFNDIYGTDEQSLTNWQNLCVALQLRNIPEELNECRELVRSTYVNIVDLVDTRVTGAKVRHFESEHQLSDYTSRTGKYFPKENAYAGGLLKFLLRRLLSTGNGDSNSSRWSGTRR